MLSCSVELQSPFYWPKAAVRMGSACRPDEGKALTTDLDKVRSEISAPFWQLLFVQEGRDEAGCL